MKANKIYSAALLTLLLLSSCATDDLAPATTAPIAGKGNVHFTLGGSAKAAASRADAIAAEAGETQVNSLYAVLFDTHQGFYKTVQATDLGAGQYDILVEKDATYDVYFFANPDEATVSKLENIPAETTYDQASTLFYGIVSAQAPDDKDNFLMYGKFNGRVTTTITRTEDLGEISISRRAARFDIVNKAEGVTVTKITFNKRSVKTGVTIGNYNPEEEGLLESTPKVYTPEGLVGSKETPTEYRHEIYSYANLSQNPDSVPTIDIEYTETIDGQEVSKKHTVQFIDQNAPAGTPLVIRQNRLYTITLTKAYKLEFNLTVADWEEEESINVKDLPIELPADVQEELNKKLLVYDLFAEYNVKSLNLTDKTVEFFDEYLADNAYPAESYIAYTALETNGITKNGAVLSDTEGNKYRMPTVGEMSLLIPATLDDDYETPDEEGYRNVPVFGNTRQINPKKYEEIVYLKNDDKNQALVNEDADNMIKGDSWFKKGGIGTVYYYGTTGTARFLNADDEGATRITFYPCYGVRFKGTDQCAAYKWEHAIMIDNDTHKRYFSVKIKALPKDSDITVYDITDNQAFWRDGYIEIKFPVNGYRGIELYHWVSSFAWTSTISPLKTTEAYRLGAFTSCCSVPKTKSNRYQLRLVKVKDAAEVQE